MKIEEKNDKFIIIDFNELEAYKVASKIEQDGIEFYENLLGALKDKKAKNGLEFLLKEERRHLKFFQDSLANLRQDQEDGFEEDDLLNYMDYRIFKEFEKIKQMHDKINNIKEALRLGVKIEDNSIVFYQSCLDNVASSKTKDELGSIIEEERRHKNLLENILSNLV